MYDNVALNQSQKTKNCNKRIKYFAVHIQIPIDNYLIEQSHFILFQLWQLSGHTFCFMRKNFLSVYSYTLQLNNLQNKKMQNQENRLILDKETDSSNKDSEISKKSNKTEEKMPKSSKKSIQKNRQSRGEWSLTQEKEYIKFLKNYRRTLNKQTGKRKNRVYKKMSEFICTRTNTQCTSHHQKMLQKYGSIQQIIRAIKQLCALKQLETENRSEIIQKILDDDNKTKPEKNLSTEQIYRNSPINQMPQFVQDIIQSSFFIQQENYTLKCNNVLMSSHEIQQQFEKRKKEESQQWQIFLSLS